MQALPDKLLHITGRRVREVGPGRGCKDRPRQPTSDSRQPPGSQGIHESTSAATAAPPQFVPGSASSQLPQGREKERKDCHTPDIVVIDAHTPENSKIALENGNILNDLNVDDVSSRSLGA
ncbi:hypothetical protein GX48_04786 [Paracoccidioides brasiliensis]|nr:hypothetical protein GX48_04786 [Paracoccidioides brasiliensis]